MTAQPRWFNFGEKANLEVRLREDGVRFLSLALSSPATSETKRAAVGGGWIFRDGKAAEHFGEFKGLRDIYEALRSFFTESELRAALNGNEAGKPPAEVAAAKERAAPKIDEVDRQIVGLSGDDQERIRAIIQHAQETVGARLASVNSLPFGGDAIGVWEKLAYANGVYDASLMMGEALFALSCRDARFKDIHADMMTAAIEGGPTPDIKVSSYVEASIKYAFKLSEAFGGEGGYLKRAFVLSAFRDMAPRVSYRVYDGGLIEAGRGVNAFGHDFRAQGGLGGAAVDDARERVRRAIVALGATLKIPPEHLFAGRPLTFFFVPSVTSHGQNVGGAALSNGVVGGVQFSPNFPGALVHELSHQVDYAGGGKRLHEAMGDTGIVTATERVVAEMEKIAGSPYPDSVKSYLLSPVEIFARVIDAGVALETIKAGDRRLLSAGGSLATLGEFYATPAPAIIRQFVKEIEPVFAPLRERGFGVEASPEKKTARAASHEHEYDIGSGLAP